MRDKAWLALALWYMCLFVVAVLLGVGCVVALLVTPAGTP